METELLNLQRAEEIIQNVETEMERQKKDVKKHRR